ncbi:MAG: hypothetical protein H0T50_08250 [Gemmatimonadales bacterium]|nr:hypothetical protein [Gemmatimonadales bacterium]
MRPILALLLLLGLAGRAAAQTPGVPLDSLYSTNSTGFAAGFMRWPTDLFCGGRASAAAQSLEPRSLLDVVQRASRCGVRVVIVPPRRFLTTTGRVNGGFSLDNAKLLTDRYAEALPPDTLRKYRGAILGLNLGDDYGCTRCWGGNKITQAQIAEWARYARTRLPGVPLGVRVTPQWVADDSTLAPLLDYAWAQYHAGKGGPREYYDKAATVADRLGLRVVMGVNVKDCYGMRTSDCTVEDLDRLGRMAMSHPASCAFINWRYDAATWERPEIREAWDDLMAVARKRRAEDCRRPG